MPKKTKLPASPGNIDDSIVDASSDANTINASAGDDAVFYVHSANADTSSTFKGGSGIDRLQLEFTESEWFALNPIIQDDLSRFLSFVAANTNAAGKVTGQWFSFDAINLTVKQFESISVTVGGVEISPADDPVSAGGDFYGAPTVLGENQTLTANVLDNDLFPDLLRSVSVVDDIPDGQGSIDFALSSNGERTTAAGIPVGQFTFDPGTDFDYVALNESATTNFNYQITDADGDSQIANVLITITGTNDQPTIISSDDAHNGAVVEDSNPSILSTGGTLRFQDFDLSDSHTASLELKSTDASVDLPGFAEADNSSAQQIGSFIIDSTVTENTSDNIDTGSLGWSFAIPSTDPVLQSLSENQSITQTYTLTLVDEHGADVSQDIVVTINGTNDAPTIESDASEHQGLVTEDADSQTLAANGTLLFQDLDLIDSHTATFTLKSSDATVDLIGFNEGSGETASNLGTFTIDPAVTENTADTDNLATLGWGFTLANDNPVLQSLAVGQTIQQVYTITVTDNNGGSLSQDVSITIAGTNDTPIAIVDAAQTTSGQTIVVDVLANDTDIDSDFVSNTLLPEPAGTLSIVSVEGAKLGSASIADDEAKIVYNADDDAIGVDYLKYTARDQWGATVIGTAVVVVSNDSLAVTLGTPNDDVIDESNNSNNLLVIGGQGDDSISTGSGDDLIVWSAGDGNDVIDAGDGFDLVTVVLSEGNPNDVTVYADDGSVIVNAPDFTLSLNGVEDLTLVSGDLSSTITIEDLTGTDIADETVTFVGGPADDRYSGNNHTLHQEIFGNGGNDFLGGGVGDDEIDGGDGDDYIYVQSGHDTVEGGSGDDIIQVLGGKVTADGGSGQDRVLGGNLDDVLSGGEGDDLVNGADGNDILNGGEGNDTLVGLAGADTLHGDSGSDILYGGADHDILDGGLGSDFLYGGTGSDSYYVDATNDQISELAGEGDDKVYASANYTLSDNIESLTLTGTANIDGTGNSLNNTLAGNSGNNSLSGGDGQDTISGADGNDTVNGGKDNDSITGGNGDDLLIGGGAPNAGIGETDNDIIRGGAGSDTIYTDSIVDASRTGVSRFDSIYFNILNYAYGDQGNDILYGGMGIDMLYGGTGNDQLFGAAFDDQLFGDSGNDTLSGGQGSDHLDGGTGADVLYGGADNDTYSVDTTADTIIEYANEGVDTIIASVSYNIPAHVENLNLTGIATQSLGNSLNNTIRANSIGSIIDGSGGNDNLLGNNGNDSLYGGLGNDLIYGGYGADSIYGGSGNDELWGSTNTVLSEAVDSGNTIYGGDGNDYINGQNGNDIIYGGNHNDFILAMGGDDFVDGGSGDDDIRAGNGNNTVYGENGNDLISSGNGNDRIFGGAGNDRISGGGGIDFLDGGAGNDIIFNDGNSATLYGGSGDDTLEVGLGTGHFLDGGPGADRMVSGNTGNSSGSATFVVDNVGDVVIAWGEATIITYLDNYTLKADPFISENNLILAPAANAQGIAVYNGSGNQLANDITGNAYNNNLVGHAGNDTISGGDGNDTLTAGMGSNHLNGGNGNDILDGTWGGGTDHLNGGAGNDSLYAGGFDSNFPAGFGQINRPPGAVDYLTGGSGNDIFYPGFDGNSAGIGNTDGINDVVYITDFERGVDKLAWAAPDSSFNPFLLPGEIDFGELTRTYTIGNDLYISALGTGGSSNTVVLLGVNTLETSDIFYI